MSRPPEHLNTGNSSSSSTTTRQRSSSTGDVLESLARSTHIKVSQLYIAIADKMKSTDSGSFEDAVKVLGELPVSEAEDALVGLLARESKREMLLVYKDGKLVNATLGAAKSDDAPKATAPVPENVDLADTVVTHTHPDGSPLSKGDILVAIDKNVLEIRATGRNGTFSMRRTGSDWGDAKKLGSSVTSSYAFGGSSLWKGSAKKFTGKVSPQEYRPNKSLVVAKRGANFAEDLSMVEHYACKELAKACKWTYSHPSEQSLAKARLSLYEIRGETGSDKREGFSSDTMPGKSGGGSLEV